MLRFMEDVCRQSRAALMSFDPTVKAAAFPTQTVRKKTTFPEYVYFNLMSCLSQDFRHFRERCWCVSWKPFDY